MIAVDSLPIKTLKATLITTLITTLIATLITMRNTILTSTFILILRK